MARTIHFRVEKETKGAVRYQEVNEDGSDVFNAAIGTLYIRKSALPGKVLDTLTVTVAELGEQAPAKGSKPKAVAA
jgi:hypothetical protein